MPPEKDPARYDLIVDLGRWLARQGLLTPEQHAAAAAEWHLSFAQGRLGNMDDLLVHHGALSREALEAAQDSLRLFGIPAETSRHGLWAMPPLGKLLMLMLGTAIDAGATGVRFLPSSKDFLVSYLLDGVWYEMESPPLHLFEPLIELLGRVSSNGQLLVRTENKKADLLIGPLIAAGSTGLLIEVVYPAA